MSNRDTVAGWTPDPGLRRRADAGLNKGEAHNALARAVFFHRREIRDRSFENQRYRASGLNLVVAAIIFWNIVYLGRAVAHLRAQGEVIGDDLLSHIAPLGWEHITFNGDYVWPTEPLENGFRPLRNPRSAFLDEVAKNLACPGWKCCHVGVRLTLIKNEDTGGFVGGIP